MSDRLVHMTVRVHNHDLPAQGGSYELPTWPDCPGCGTARPANVAEEITAEGERATARHGEPSDRSGLEWLAILAEEFGEAAMEVTKGEVPPVDPMFTTYRSRLRAELVQVASVASRWILAIDRGEGTR